MSPAVSHPTNPHVASQGVVSLEVAPGIVVMIVLPIEHIFTLPKIRADVPQGIQQIRVMLKENQSVFSASEGIVSGANT